MNVTVNEVDQHKVTLHIEVPAKDASKQAAAACKNLASRVNIPGFRKGKHRAWYWKASWAKMLSNRKFLKLLPIKPTATPSTRKASFL